MTPPKNLLERATPELLKAIAQYKVDYPNTATAVENDLSKNIFVTDITYGTLNRLDNICRSVNLGFRFDNPYTLFRDF